MTNFPIVHTHPCRHKRVRNLVLNKLEIVQRVVDVVVMVVVVVLVVVLVIAMLIENVLF